MEKGDIYNNYSVKDFAEICKGMSTLDVVVYASEVLNSIDSYDFSKGGYYHNKKDRIYNLKRFLKSLIFFFSTGGSHPAGLSESDYAYLHKIKDSIDDI